MHNSLARAVVPQYTQTASGNNMPGLACQHIQNNLKIHFNIDSGTSEEQVSKQSVLFLLLFLVQYIGWIRNFPSADYLEIDAYASALPPTNLPCVAFCMTQDCLLSFLMLLKCRQQFLFFFSPLVQIDWFYIILFT